MAVCKIEAIQNGEIKRKFLRFYKKQFQWDLFKKLFVVLFVALRFPSAYRSYTVLC